jgi:peptide/nickel transport system permease protein
MLDYIVRRILLMVPTLFVISVLSFAIIQLPPGDYLTSYMANLSQMGEQSSQEVVEALRVRYGLDKPVYIQYLKWIGGVLRGDLGQSFIYRQPVSELIWQRLGFTVTISVLTMLLTWAIAVPLGIYSATHQYKFFDYFFTFLGFIGMSTPGFLLALVMLYVSWRVFGTSVGGLFSDEFIAAPWSLEKFWDMLCHMWVPVAVLAVGGTAVLVRQIRANLLDQLKMPYVEMARARGLSEGRLLVKYPLRIAINPLVSSIGWMLPELISGSLIVAMVLSLPTTGPLLISALMQQDMHLAGSFVLILSVLTVIGTLISDILLAIVDPRIRFGKNDDG